MKSSHATGRKHPYAQRANRNFQPRLEALENRLALAAITWDGGSSGTGTAWNTAANWVGDVLPGTVDDAVIGPAFSGVTITSSGAVTIKSLTNAATLQITGG